MLFVGLLNSSVKEVFILTGRRFVMMIMILSGYHN